MTAATNNTTKRAPLADRIDQKATAVATTTNTGTEVATPPVDNATVLRGEITRMEAEFAKAMPKGLEATQLVRDAITAVRTVKNLDRCDSASVLGALMTCAQLGLRPNVLGQAFVLPYWSARDRRYRAQFVVGYPGLVELAHGSDKIADLSFRPVYENDEFDIDYGTGVIRHKPNLRGRRGEAYGYYALVRYPNGGVSWFYMSKEDAEDYRDRFATSRNKEGQIIGPWRDHFDAMAAKSCLRQLAKYMPKNKALATAIAADESLRVDLATDGDPAVVSAGLEVNQIDGSVVEHDSAIAGETVPAG